MKRRNFLSGLFAAPLALKARVLAFLGRKPEPCGALILEAPEQSQPQPARSRPSAASNQSLTPRSLTARQREVVQLLAEGKSMKEVADALGVAPRTVDCGTARKSLFFCSLPRGHKGPHMLVNRQVKLTRLSFGPKNIALS